MALDLHPRQHPAVRGAVVALLEDQGDEPDAWWMAGLDDLSDPAYSSTDGPDPLRRDQGDATARPRRTLGAERA
jgi:hypothetical protein